MSSRFIVNNPLVVILESRLKENKKTAPNGDLMKSILTLRSKLNYSVCYQTAKNECRYIDAFDKNTTSKFDSFCKNGSLDGKTLWTIDEMDKFLINARQMVINHDHDSVLMLICGDGGIIANDIGVANIGVLYSHTKEEYIEYSEIFDQSLHHASIT